ncbi:hypothetical protein H0E87_030606, partial [Populus deltoides]
MLCGPVHDKASFGASEATEFGNLPENLLWESSRIPRSVNGEKTSGMGPSQLGNSDTELGIDPVNWLPDNKGPSVG